MNGNRESWPKQHKANLKNTFSKMKFYLFTLDSQSSQYCWSSSHSLMKGQPCHLLELQVGVYVLFLQQLS